MKIIYYIKKILTLQVSKNDYLTNSLLIMVIVVIGLIIFIFSLKISLLYFIILINNNLLIPLYYNTNNKWIKISILLFFILELFLFLGVIYLGTPLALNGGDADKIEYGSTGHENKGYEDKESQEITPQKKLPDAAGTAVNTNNTCNWWKYSKENKNYYKVMKNGVWWYYPSYPSYPSKSYFRRVIDWFGGWFKK